MVEPHFTCHRFGGVGVSVVVRGASRENSKIPCPALAAGCLVSSVALILVLDFFSPGTAGTCCYASVPSSTASCGSTCSERACRHSPRSPPLPARRKWKTAVMTPAAACDVRWLETASTREPPAPHVYERRKTYTTVWIHRAVCARAYVHVIMRFGVVPRTYCVAGV